ncbi:MAG TPA: hypothetical protein VFR02_05540 [bacterium]|nr:hypothetical protein [bacterium]
MAKAKKTEENVGSGVLDWAAKAFQAWQKGLKPALALFAEKLEERAERLERRVMGLLVAYLSFFAGVFFLALGSFFLLIDLAGLPRWAVFSGGGLLFLATSVVYLKASRGR